jgi:hypothetical protein
MMFITEEGEKMLLIARRTALAAACCYYAPYGLVVWLAVAARTAGWGLKVLYCDGNGDPAVGNYHPCAAVRLVSGVCACFRAALMLFLILAAAILVGQG